LNALNGKRCIVYCFKLHITLEQSIYVIRKGQSPRRIQPAAYTKPHKTCCYKYTSYKHVNYNCKGDTVNRRKSDEIVQHING